MPKNGTESGQSEIPNINIGETYDERLGSSGLHIDTLANMSAFFGRDMRAHRHDRHYQLHFLESGTVQLDLGGQLYQGSGPLFFFTPPTMPHSFSLCGEISGVAITLRQDVLKRTMADSSGIGLEAQFNTAVFVEFAALGGSLVREAKRLPVLIQMLSEEFYQSGTSRDQALQGLVGLILVCVSRLSELPERSASFKQQELKVIQQFNALIEAHYSNQWPLERYAAELQVSVGKLADICRRLCGKSPKALVHERQLEEARWQLTYTSAPVSSIAYQLGFADPAYFCRFFKKQTGQSPSLFRKQMARSPDVQQGY